MHFFHFQQYLFFINFCNNTKTIAGGSICLDINHNLMLLNWTSSHLNDTVLLNVLSKQALKEQSSQNNTD